MASVLLGLILAALPPFVVPQPPVLEVNCDTGQSLEKALPAVQKSPGATMRIRGTCVGNSVLTTGSVRLEGVAGGVALLQAPDPRDRRAVPMVKDASDVETPSLHFQHKGQSGAGLAFQQSHRGRIFDCEFDQNEVVVVYQWSDDGEVWRSSMHDNKCGVLCPRRSSPA